ncbi:hypothetical protein AAIH46_18020 [Rhizobium sp. 0TCS1.26]|uniref:hypothetical protein n=1 Tax=Rhizobium sp. 0TCS1.26 TaxID=3142623 RepID=UPI003D2AAA9D
MGIRVTTAPHIDQLAARQGGMSAFEEYYVDDHRPEDRPVIQMVESADDWRSLKALTGGRGTVARFERWTS